MLPPVISNEDERTRFFRGKGHTGLSNLGNTCFMNTILQCLSKSFEFTEYMLTAEEGSTERKYKNDLIRKGVEQTSRGYRLTGNEIERIQKRLALNWEQLLFAMYSTNTVLAPRTLHRTIQELSLKMGRMEFVGHGQKDAEEFYGFLMEQMHMGLCYPVRFNVTGKPKNKIDEMALEAYKSWNIYFTKEYSKVVKFFYGQEYSLLTCPKCGYQSGTYQPMNRIHLPIPSTESDVSLHDCFRLYNEGETLDSDNTWKCEGCNENVEAKKNISIWKKPKYLVIHLKRFTSSGSKINTFVDCPLTDLTIDEYCIGYGRDLKKYNLYATANHSGDTGGGHYYAYCKDYDDVWREYNDTSVSVCDESKLITENTYLLFYKMV